MECSSAEIVRSDLGLAIHCWGLELSILFSFLLIRILIPRTYHPSVPLRINHTEQHLYSTHRGSPFLHLFAPRPCSPLFDHFSFSVRCTRLNQGFKNSSSTLSSKVGDSRNGQVIREETRAGSGRIAARAVTQGSSLAHRFSREG